MALTGFDPSKVQASINGVKNAYENLNEAICNQMQNNFINGMSDKWASPQAQQYFENTVKPLGDNMITASNQTFESVVTSMDEAAFAWARQGNAESMYSRSSIEINSKKLDVSNIKDNIGGVIGIDLEAATEVVNGLNTIEQNVTSALDQLSQSVNDCGFLGGDQASTLQSTINTIKSTATDAFSTIRATIKQSIDNTVSNYGDTAGKISNAFAGE